ncbi:gephyrin isoform X3 [Hydra vulgaris]|uniref:Gephyrin isoform X3 n=1 Tax=Hydra vulgaris TaxID=6087 RepID=A0ABM4CGQ9_HYDVU
MATLYENLGDTSNTPEVVPRQLKVGILTVSDRCSAGTQEDKSGPNLKILVESHLQRLGSVNVLTGCVPDEFHIIKSCLTHWSDNENCVLILTTGGTGFSLRDVTPEATKDVIDRDAPGLTVCMLSKSIESTPTAMLSRPVCGIRKSTIICNLPGSKKGSQECFEFILPALGHAFDLVLNNIRKIELTHTNMTKVTAQVHKENIKKSPPHCHGRTESTNEVICLVQNCQNQYFETPPMSIRGSLDSLHSNDSSIDSSEYSQSSTENNHVCPHRKTAVYIDTPKVAERDRFSPYPMLQVHKALSIILGSIQPMKKRHLVNLHAGLLGKILMEDIRAKEPYPPFPASVKDGYAVIAADGSGVRKVIEPIYAGHMPQQSISSGECSRITTGAPIPPGADAVVQVEDTEVVEKTKKGDEILVNIKSIPVQKQDIRPIGFDIRQGETLLYAGEKLGPSELGLLAMAGINTVPVYSPPSIGVFSSGDELVPPGEEKGKGQIYDSNKIALIAAIREQGFNAADLGVLPDNPSRLCEVLLNIIDDTAHQIVITTGGVSMGEKDLIKKFLEKFGDIKFGRVNMKPGKPTTFATIKRGSITTYFFALPGNPVSAIVTFYLFVLPAIRKLAGFSKPNLQRIQARLSFDINLDIRPEYHRVCLNWDTDDGVPLAITTGSQCSSRLLSMRSCHALVEMPSNETVRNLTKGSLVTALLIPKLIT